MNKQPLTADKVLEVATSLITANGSTTTYDVKVALRKENYEAFQHQVSQIMMDLFGQGKLASTNDSSRPYQIYDLPKNSASSASTQDLNDLAKDILQNGPAAQQDILIALGTAGATGTVLRKDIATQHGDSKADSAFAALVKKGVIRRTATKGVYELAIVSTPIPNTGKTPPVPQVDEKEEKLQELANFLSEGIKKLEEIHQSIVTGLAEYNNIKIKQN